MKNKNEVLEYIKRLYKQGFTDCIEWPLKQDKHGRGRVNDSRTEKVLLAHRWIYQEIIRNIDNIIIWGIIVKMLHV